MKIGKYFNLPNARKQAAPSPTSPTVTSPIEAEVKEETRPPTPPKTFKKKALLIGVQEVREREDVAAVVSPLSAKFPVAGLQRIKTKREKKKRDKLSALRGPHRDVRSMRQLLIDVYRYAPEDIVMLIDDDKPEQKQPTRENILDEIKNLVKDAEEHDRFFFHFAGHSDQEDTDDIKEEDRKNEFILTSDGERIKDDELRAKLAKPLPTGSSLIAVFDSCHSGSLLDLNHFRCNQVYVPWTNKGNRKTNTLWNANKRMQANISLRGAAIARRNRQSFKPWMRTSIDEVALSSPRDSVPNSTHNHVKIPTGDLKHARALSVVTDMSGTASAVPSWLESPNKIQCASPVALYCTGYCREDLKLFAYEETLDADVISISSAQDNQISWEDSNGRSMTQCLVNILRDSQHPTYRELMTLISHDIHDYYVGLHSRARDYRKLVRKVNAANIKKGKKPKQGDVVEMNNFQDPQLSTDRPLDMSRQFYP